MAPKSLPTIRLVSYPQSVFTHNPVSTLQKYCLTEPTKILFQVRSPGRGHAARRRPEFPVRHCRMLPEKLRSLFGGKSFERQRQVERKILETIFLMFYYSKL